MAGKPKRMGQIKQLIRLHQQGLGKKTIARQLGMSKNTVKAYLQKIETGELAAESLLSLDEPVLEGKLFAGSPSYKQERYDSFKDELDYFSKELQRVGVTRRVLWDEYRQSHPGGYRYTQFCHHLSQYLINKNPSMVLQHKAGEKLFIDFAGKKLSYVNKETGEVIGCQVFVACLPHSDYSFVMAVHSQGIDDFIYALSCCLKEIGGVPQALVPDNLKAAIIKTNRYEPNVNRVLEDFANHYRTTVAPARVRKPKDKALVENQVKLIYSRVYAKLRNQQFFDIQSLNKAIVQKVKEHNQTRMQEKGYCRQEKFLSDEKHVLKPLPATNFEIKYYKELKVAQNNHIRLAGDKHYYSVPYAHIGSRAKVIYTRSMVRIYVKGEQVAVHRRSYAMGKYSTEKEHLCSQHQHYLNRSPGYYMNKAKAKSDALYHVVRQLFAQDKYPEQLYRTCDGLLSLQRKTDKAQFDKACSIAIEYNNYSYWFIQNILKNKMTGDMGTVNEKPLPAHKNVRGAGCYK
ncbi:MAG: IS21 family transposase [Candidatus Marinimicrobia bacterium]|jgi:transposase|nr:IS21 family transposase [Candidatus Neomarinimicrobiota bacterium]